jgi:hypothetical protein
MRCTAAVLTLLALAAGPALADPQFRGPELYDGAWSVTRAWSDWAAGPNDRSKGSFAYAYRVWSVERAQRHEDEETRLDCADLSIDMIIEYAAANGLPLEWRVYNAPEKKFVTIKNTDRQFDTPADFSTWSKHFLGAMNLADNTTAITYSQWAGGDMVLMNWNQSPEEPNFPGRTVWHTFLIAVPDELIFYGNIDAGQPLPVISTSSASRLDMVRTSPDRHGLSPRRFTFLANAVKPPEANPPPSTGDVVVNATALNLRAGPVGTAPVVIVARRDDRFPVLARQGLWVKVRLPDGRSAWGHSLYLRAAPLGGLVTAVVQ